MNIKSIAAILASEGIQSITINGAGQGSTNDQIHITMARKRMKFHPDYVDSLLKAVEIDSKEMIDNRQVPEVDFIMVKSDTWDRIKEIIRSER